jgi:hypothetical protein
MARKGEHDGEGLLTIRSSRRRRSSKDAAPYQGATTSIPFGSTQRAWDREYTPPRCSTLGESGTILFWVPGSWFHFLAPSDVTDPQHHDSQVTHDTA